eukprot:1193759-Prorocentrum_minimum.AAC.2
MHGGTECLLGGSCGLSHTYGTAHREHQPNGCLYTSSYTLIPRVNPIDSISGQNRFMTKHKAWIGLDIADLPTQLRKKIYVSAHVYLLVIENRGFPTWEINGKKIEGDQTFKELAKASGTLVALLPDSRAPAALNISPPSIVRADANAHVLPANGRARKLLIVSVTRRRNALSQWFLSQQIITESYPYDV